MRRRALTGAIKRYKQQASEFNCSPELVWLLDSSPLWDHLIATIKQINSGLQLGAAENLTAPLDKLQERMVELQILLEERQGK